MTKRLSAVFLVLILVVLGYLFYKSNPFTKQLDATELVSGEAIFVFETTAPVSVWNRLVTQPIWERLSVIPSLSKVESQLITLDSLTGQSGNLGNILRGHQFVVSLHPTAKSEFDFLFLVAFEKGKQEEFIKAVKSHIGDSKKVSKRSYSRETIYEYRDPSKFEGVVSYAFLNNVIVASYSSFLIEETIRQALSEDLVSFKEEYKDLYKQMPSVGKEEGVLRIGSKGVARFARGVARTNRLEFFEDFSQQGIAANLTLNFDGNRLLLEGLAVIGKDKNINFTNKKSGGGDLFGKYISNRTALFYQYNVKDLEQIVAIQNPTFEQKNTLQGELEKQVLDQGFFQNMEGEVGYMILERMPNMPSDKIILMKTNEPENQIKLLKSFGLEMNQGDSSRVISDYHLESEIFIINLPELPAHLFQGQFKGFPNTYVTAYGDMLVMGNNVKAVKLFLDDVYNDNTWGHSFDQKKFLEGIRPEAGFNFLVSLSHYWSAIVQESAPDWQVKLRKYAPQLLSIDLIALGLTEEDAHQQLQVEIDFNLDVVTPVKDVLLAENLSVRFSEKLVYGPKAVENFNDRSTDFLVQDETNRIHFFNDEGERIFDRQLEGGIVSELYQIDYYKNGKLQLVFATTDAIYGFDRLGKSLPGYPIRLNRDVNISHLKLLDYNNTRDYRYFVGLENGDLYIFDKRGHNLEGWMPKKTSGSLASTPAHYRLSGMGDFMIAMNHSGDLYLMNRRGELQTDKPIYLGGELATDYVLIQRGDFLGAQLATVTETGEVVQVNLKGELTYRNQLFKPDRDTHFHLVKDQSDDRYLYVVHEYNKVSVLNAEQDLLFEKEMVSEEMGFQYFSFGSDKNVFVVIDYVQAFIYLYNLEGDLLNTRPINGSQEIEVKYSGSKNEFNIYAVHENEFTFYKMPF